MQQTRFFPMWVAISLIAAVSAFGQEDDRLVGIWASDDGFQVIEFLFRSDGRYQMDTRSTDPDFGFSSTERGRYEVSGQALTLTPYDFFGEPQGRPYEFEVAGDLLTLMRPEFFLTEVYQFKPGSKTDVLARENVDADLTATWGRHITFYGKEEFTFRPDGYYFRKDTPENSEFPPDYIRGRYEQNGTRLTMTPYSGTEAEYEIDFFGNTLTLISADETFGEAKTYEELPGSGAEVRAKSAEANAFLSSENWQVGVWEIRNGVNTVDLTIRPDGHYISTNDTEILRGIVRGRYILEPRRIHFSPFVGQGLYSRDNGDFGKVERTRELDYYDGELQLIELDAISQSVTSARKRPGSEMIVLEKTLAAQAEREREDWHVGVWEVHDPDGWMEFTFRPDNRYIAKSGTDGSPSRVERGQYLLASGKITLAPYAGLGTARGFELDLYDGDLFLVGDTYRMVVARKLPGSDAEVIEKTVNPIAMKGERGSILGLWTANLPGQAAELVFRHDGQFRLTSCANETISHDYGLYSVDMASRTLVYDSRFVPVQTLELDFYGDTLTIHGGLKPPSTYTVNLGVVDAAIEASFAADAEEAQIDAHWLTRTPIQLRDPNAVQLPAGDIPADPNPGRIFESPMVFSSYHLYRWLIPGFVYFNELGTIKSVPVLNTREWHFFPTGRVLVRFKNYRAGLFYPTTVADVSDSWGAYHVGPKPTETDILHLYADNGLFLDTDLGDQIEMTLEDGRRNLFWGKDYQILSEWAAERERIPCEPPANYNLSLMNTGVQLSTEIEPDKIGGGRPILFSLTGPVAGNFTISGTTDVAGNLVVERAVSLVSPIDWEPVQTNSVPPGAFSFETPQGPHASAFYRVRGE